ncbi:DUF5677 domain-containing protein [Pseudomonas plecoglossicida]
MDSFRSRGFFSSDIDELIVECQNRLKDQKHELSGIVEAALDDILGNQTRNDLPYLVGLLYWFRTIEACQGAVVLAEHGMPTAPASTLRIAFECLFYACAVWRDDSVLPLLEGSHDKERIKQASQMLQAGAESHFQAEQLETLREVASEGLEPPSISVWDAAQRAGFTLDYETAYRGLGMMGAHATLRSLDSYFNTEADGSVQPRFMPDYTRSKWVLDLAKSCLRGGLSRHREALATPQAMDETVSPPHPTSR